MHSRQQALKSLLTTYFLKQKGIEVYSEKEIPMVAKRIKMLENLHSARPKTANLPNYGVGKKF